MRKLYAIILVAVAWACSGPAPQPQPIADLLAKQGSEADYAALGAVMGTSVSPEAYEQSAAVAAFKPVIDRVFPTLKPLEDELGSMLERAKSDSLGLPPLRFAAVAWGYPQSIVRVDTVVLIALNHYLGADFDGYSHLQAYQRQAKTPEMLPYNLAEALAATQHPYEREGQSVLTRMLYEGALVEAVMSIVPGARLPMAVGCTQEELKWMEDHEKEIWNDMALRRMVYDSSPLTIDRLFQPSPSAPMLDGTAPGRAARYIGYRIVRAYQAKHHLPLAALLSPSFYANPDALLQSGY